MVKKQQMAENVEEHDDGEVLDPHSIEVNVEDYRRELGNSASPLKGRASSMI